MNQLLSLQDGKIALNDVYLKSTAGDVDHTGNFAINGKLSVQSDIEVKSGLSVGADVSVKGSITVDTLKVKNLVTDMSAFESVGQWDYPTQEELNGKGLSWTWGNNETIRLMYRTGGRLWTNSSVDLGAGKSYKIDNVDVINATQLGSQIRKSNLTEVGTLKSLNVSGDANLGQFLFLNSNSNRIGINTEDPRGIIGIVDHAVELTIDVLASNKAIFGTHTNHDVSIISDGLDRITVKNNGEVHIGDEKYHNGTLRVFGTLYAENVISETRVERTLPLEFRSDRETGIYGKGLLWTGGTGSTKQLVMKANPDRLWSTDSFEIAKEKEYFIGGESVLTQNSLGSSVLRSSLVAVGALESLTVVGESNFTGALTARSATIQTLNLKTLNSNTITINASEQQAFYADDNSIEIGNKVNNKRPVKVFGPLSIGINNPDDDVDLAVRGNFSFAEKKFITGAEAPTAGTYNKGDICWNSDPKEFAPIGWVCVSAGQWLPFGAITRR